MELLTDLLQTSCMVNGKALNALSFPMIFAPVAPHLFFSEAIAWEYVQGCPWCKWKESYPASTSHFGLTATTGAYHKFHINSNGTGIFVEVVIGWKIWVLVVLKGEQGPDLLANINLYRESHDFEGENAHLCSTSHSPTSSSRFQLESRIPEEFKKILKKC